MAGTTVEIRMPDLRGGDEWAHHTSDVSHLPAIVENYVNILAEADPQPAAVFLGTPDLLVDVRANGEVSRFSVACRHVFECHATRLKGVVVTGLRASGFDGRQSPDNDRKQGNGGSGA